MLKKIMLVCSVFALAACAGANKDETLRSADYVYFRFDSSELTPRADAELRRLFVTTEHPQCANVRLIGHSDHWGPDDYNDPLSIARATAVRDVLLNEGFVTERVSIDGLGKRAPLTNPGDTPEVAPQNRVVEVYVLPRISWWNDYHCKQMI